MSKWKHFTDEEGEGMDPEIMNAADRSRERAGIPFIATCYIRTADENAKVHGVTDSAHMTGHAIDFRVTDSTQLYKMLDAFLEEKILRIVIGIKPGAKTMDEFYHNIHIDNDPTKPQGIVSIKIYN